MRTDELQQQLDKLHSLIKDIRTGILLTHNGSNKIQGRPMATAGIDEDGTIWYFTNEFSGKAHDIENNSDVYITYSDASSNSYVTISGTASIENDKQKMEELYTPAVKVWFPQGLEDPKLALLKVQPIEAEYWDNSSSKIVILFHMLKSVITGDKYTEGEHAAVKF